jgi:sodium-dependent dicarboxylate transporter 2/3/5
VGRQRPEYLRGELAQLGAWTRGEKNVVWAFGTTVGLWLLPGMVGLAGGADSAGAKWLGQHLPEGVAALLGAGLLFVLPLDFKRGEFTLGWSEAVRIDWGTILLFGGGLALGDAMFTTGLAEWFGRGVVERLQVESALGLTALFGLLGVLLTETTSNTAAANMLVPVAIGVAKAAGVDPMGPALAASLGASLAFMLPVSTPPNAVVFGSGCVPILKMVRHGLVMDVMGFIALVATVHWVVPWALRQ